MSARSILLVPASFFLGLLAAGTYYFSLLMVIHDWDGSFSSWITFICIATVLGFVLPLVVISYGQPARKYSVTFAIPFWIFGPVLTVVTIVFLLLLSIIMAFFETDHYHP
ncbi:MAG: hypothetical protein SVY53_05085 [Chloroflexota bacterium]|nr:hypothetical protein [Chloroflexota bacterium]